MKVILLTALIGTILLSLFGALSEVYITNGAFLSGLYYFLILAGVLILPLIILTWIYNTLLSKLPTKNPLYRLGIGVLIALSILLIVMVVDKAPRLDTVYFFIGSSILLTLIHLLLEKKYKIG